MTMNECFFVCSVIPAGPLLKGLNVYSTYKPALYRPLFLTTLKEVHKQLSSVLAHNIKCHFCLQSETSLLLHAIASSMPMSQSPNLSKWYKSDQK